MIIVALSLLTSILEINAEEKAMIQPLGLSETGINVLENLSIFIHRNGEAESCSSTVKVCNLNSDIDSCGRELLHAFRSIILSSPPTENFPKGNKYYVDSLITTALAYFLLPHGNCGVEEIGTETNFLSFCYQGNDKTPKMPFHHEILPVLLPPGATTLPCHFHTREGLRLDSLESLVNAVTESNNVCDEEGTCSSSNEKELHLYAVPAGRVFMFAPAHVGETFTLSHVHSVNPDISPHIELEVISLSPRLFEVKNFFTKDDAQNLIDNILQETVEDFKLRRSSTGATGYSVNSHRTSEGGFDTSSHKAMEIKRRCFSVLGFDYYDDNFADGLQILRYNHTGAYVSHHDYLDDPNNDDEHDYDSAYVGTNRFATMLLYFNTLSNGEGGETVFPNASPADKSNVVEHSQAIEQFRTSEFSNAFEQGSWQETLIGKCQSRLSVKPYATRVVLFYSQFPDGSLDDDSIHGACPVFNDTKWAANLWIWNGPMRGELAPRNEEAVQKHIREGKYPDVRQVQATFRNSNTDPAFKNAQLYFKGDFWGEIGFHSKSINMNTFLGHVWSVKVNGEIVTEWVVGEDSIQEFVL